MINGVDSIQSFLNQELQLKVEAQSIQQFYNQIIQPLNPQQQLNSTMPQKLKSRGIKKLIEYLDYIIQEPFEKYALKQRNDQLLERMKSKEIFQVIFDSINKQKTFLEKDTLFEIVIAQNVSERNDSCASNTNNGCLKIVITDGVYLKYAFLIEILKNQLYQFRFAFTAIEISKIPQIPTDLKQIRNKKILIRQNTKIQFKMLFINPNNAFLISNSQNLIKTKEKPILNGVLPQRITQDSQFFSNSNNQTPTVNLNILKIIDQDSDDDDDEDEELELQ